MADTNVLDKYAQRTREEKQRYWMWTLFIVGILLVCFAVPFSPIFVPQDGHDGYRADQAQDAATTLRLLGIMAFMTGLAERIIMVLSRK